MAMPAVVSVLSFIAGLWSKIKLGLAFIGGMMLQKKKQKDAAQKDKDSARLIRDEMEDKTEDQLDDILGGPSR